MIHIFHIKKTPTTQYFCLCLLTVFHSHNMTIGLMWNCQECLRQERSLLLPKYTGAKILTWYLDFGKSYSVLCLGGSRIFSFLLLFNEKCNLMEGPVIDIVALWVMFLPSWAFEVWEINQNQVFLETVQFTYATWKKKELDVVLLSNMQQSTRSYLFEAVTIPYPVVSCTIVVLWNDFQFMLYSLGWFV